MRTPQSDIGRCSPDREARECLTQGTVAMQAARLTAGFNGDALDHLTQGPPVAETGSQTTQVTRICSISSDEDRRSGNCAVRFDARLALEDANPGDMQFAL